ncbi:NAD(P)-binding domain-containing protein [Streptomyces sp. NPDC007325]|uniref:NAD(P)-binding domain-containing protein n=1 Tax=Streptomyces sp. NPDC007325 TaxID=3154588 RepID=UPI0033C71BD0
MRVGIIGAGAMGRAMARRAARAGSIVRLADRSAGRARLVARETMAGTPGVVEASSIRAALRPGLVILALDRADSLEFLRRHGRLLAGKVLVEVTAPRTDAYGTDAYGTDPCGADPCGADAYGTDPCAAGPCAAGGYGSGASGAGMGDLMAAVPGASWVRACAAGDAESIYRGLIDGHPVDIFVAADDESAKIRVIELANRSGLRALDAGRLDRARVLDELTSLGREISHRLAAPEGWAIKLLPSW